VRLVGVGEDGGMVLGAHVGLHALSVGARPLVDVLPRLVRPDKGHRLKVV
jgi:hypothetical protein